MAARVGGRWIRAVRINVCATQGHATWRVGGLLERLDVAGADPREEGGGGARRVGARSRESALNRPDMPGGLNEARRHRFNRLDENEKEIVA